MLVLGRLFDDRRQIANPHGRAIDQLGVALVTIFMPGLIAP